MKWEVSRELSPKAGGPLLIGFSRAASGGSSYEEENNSGEQEKKGTKPLQCGFEAVWTRDNNTDEMALASQKRGVRCKNLLVRIIHPRAHLNSRKAKHLSN